MEEAMSDVSSGARAPDATPGVDVPSGPLTTPAYPATETYSTGTYTSETYPAGTTSAGDDESKAKQVAGQAKEVAGQSTQAAGQAASEVKDTAKEQAQRVAGEARQQFRSVASDLRSKAGDQARSQNDRLVGTIRQTADQLEEMRGDRADSPAATVVSRFADGGRQLADYLDRNGPDGVLREVQDFARRRPGAFLATALAAGFVVGRLGKGVAKADEAGSGWGKPSSDAFYSGTPGYTDTPGYSGTQGYSGTPGYSTADTTPAPATYVDPAVETSGYPTSTEYASTGTGTPVVVEEDYPGEERYPGRQS
jgi:uncharacterized protein YjbJ (UPF0337 family)